MFQFFFLFYSITNGLFGEFFAQKNSFQIRKKKKSHSINIRAESFVILIFHSFSLFLISIDCSPSDTFTTYIRKN